MSKNQEMCSKSLRCRFCSKEQPYDSIINLKQTKKQRNSVYKKLRVFREEIVDFSNNSLPETMCDACYSTLDICYNFFVQVKQAQEVVSTLSEDVKVKEDQPSTKAIKQEIDSLAFDSWIDINIEPATADLSWSSYPWSCLNCNASLPSLQELRTHSKQSHEVCCAFRCQDCNKQTIKFDEFVDHVRGHRPYLKEYCQYCNIKMETPSHIESHTSNNNCTFCGETFHDDTLLLAHLKQYVPKMNENKFFDMALENIDNKDNTRKVCNTLRNIQDINATDLKLPKCVEKYTVNYPTFSKDLTKPNIYTDNEENKSKKKVQKKLHDSTDYPMWSQYPNICKFCQETHISKSNLRRHSVRKHQKCFATKCIDCENDLSETWEQFIEHVKGHRPYLKNFCHYCDAKIENTQHFRMHKPIRNGKYLCNTCGHDFKGIMFINLHKIALEKPFQERRKTPIKTKSPTEKKVRKKKEKIERTCEICSKSVKNMSAHKETHMNRTRDFTCDRCGKAFMDMHTVKKHSLTHNERTELCKICGKYFTTVALLKKHVMSHNIIKPFQCDHCKKFFNTKSNLRTHIIVHMDVKEYACKYCQKKFKNGCRLRDHVRLHTGERPYVCQTCDARFACWASCASHAKRVHGVSIAKRTQTPHGLLDIDLATGQPRQINLSSEVEEWTKNIVMNKQYTQSDKN